MNASGLIECWKDFSVIQPFLNPSNWNNTKSWTIETIGRASFEGEHSPFGKALCEKNKDTLIYRKEEWNIDLVIARKERLSTTAIGVEPSANWLLPAIYEVCLEHETNCLDSWQEMIKLIYMRAKLKVLISYNIDSDGTPSQEERVVGVERRVVEQFDSMIDASNQVHADNPATEYAMILGRLCNNQIIWKAWTRKSSHGAFKVVREWYRS